VRLGAWYLVAVAVLAAVITAISWPVAMPGTWLVPACLLFLRYLQVGFRAGVFRETASELAAVLVALIATAAFTLLGLIVATNIWLTRGRGI